MSCSELISLRFISTSINFRMEAEAGCLSVDWGNGDRTVYSGKEYYEITYNYPSDGEYSIQITGRQITCLNLSCLGLSELELKNCTFLSCLDCSGNELEELDLGDCPGLEELYANSNNLNRICLSGLTELQFVNLTYNGLKRLEISGLQKLRTVYCSRNSLETVELIGCPSLCCVNVADNCLGSPAVRDLFRQLPLRDRSDNAMLCCVGNTSSDEDAARELLSAKKWNIFL